jgi:hypothetical protein
MSFPGIRSNILLFALAVVPLRSASAHGSGAISLSSKQSAPGSAITIFGTEFANNSSVRLELRSILETVVFGRVQTSAKGTFQQLVTIPAGSKPGQYAIVAVAPDGDVTAQATLMIAYVATAQETHPGMHDMPGMQGMGGAHATADMMDVPIPITPWGWTVIAVIVLVSAATGVWLLRAGRPMQAV